MGAILDLVKVLYEPAAVFERVREKPRFLHPFLPLAVVIIVLSILQLPYTRAAMAERMTQMAQQNPQAAQMAERFTAVGIVAAPIVFAVILVIVAAVLWLLVSMVGGEGKFTTLLSVATYAAVATVLYQVAGIGVLTLKGTADVTSVQDLQPALGLDLLAPGASGFLLAVLRGINPFSIWGAFLTATGIAVTHRTSKGAAWTVAVIMLLLGVVIRGAFAAMGSR